MVNAYNRAQAPEAACGVRFRWTPQKSEAASQLPRRYHLAMVVDSSDSPFWDMVYQGAQRRAEEKDAYVELMETQMGAPYRLNDQLNMAVAARVDGAFIVPDGTQAVAQAMADNAQSEQRVPLLAVMEDVEAQSRGAEVLVQVAGGEVQKQIEQIRGLISKGVDAIVIVAVDCNALTDVIREAKSEGIYVVSYDRLIMNAPVDLHISFDSEQVGIMLAQNMVEQLPKNGNIACIHGSEQDANVQQMRKGIESVIRGSSQHIISNDYCDGWDAEQAYEVMQDLLNCNVKVDGVICGNDDLANLVYKALAERGMTERVCLVGQDACQRIVSGWQAMTVYKPVELLARKAAEDTIALVEQGSVATDTRMDNGSTEVPAVLLEPVAVTAENMFLGNEMKKKNGSLDWDRVYSEAEKHMKRVGLEESAQTLIKDIGTGKQQLVEIAKAFSKDVKLLILDEPTRGIDVSAKYDIYCLVNEMVANGKSVIMISSEMPELLGMCDRIYVMNEGECVADLDAEGLTQEKIMSYIIKASN